GFSASILVGLVPRSQRAFYGRALLPATTAFVTMSSDGRDANDDARSFAPCHPQIATSLRSWTTPFLARLLLSALLMFVHRGRAVTRRRSDPGATSCPAGRLHPGCNPGRDTAPARPGTGSAPLCPGSCPGPETPREGTATSCRRGVRRPRSPA